MRHRRALVAALTALALAALAACSSDSDSPVGSEFVGSVLGTEPGTVFQDTIEVTGDTVLAYSSLFSTSTSLEVGRRDGYTRVAIVRPSFSPTNGDENRVVTGAALRMRLLNLNVGEDIVVRFYALASPFKEADSLAALDTIGVILDPTTGSADRVINLANAVHPLPPELVQAWVRGDSANNGIAIIYQDDGAARLGTFDSSEKGGTDRPRVEIDFQDGTDSSYDMSDDATFVRPVGTTSNLIVSDGYVRRIWFRVELDQLSDSSAVHVARIRFNVVPGTVSGFNQVELFIPGSTDVTSSAFLGGTLVNSVYLGAESEKVEFTVTNTFLGVLNGALKDTGFVMRFVGEKSAVRYAEFYTSAAGDSLAPAVFLTSSTPAVFDRE